LGPGAVGREAAEDALGEVLAAGEELLEGHRA